MLGIDLHSAWRDNVDWAYVQTLNFNLGPFQAIIKSYFEHLVSVAHLCKVIMDSSTMFKSSITSLGRSHRWSKCWLPSLSVYDPISESHLTVLWTVNPLFIGSSASSVPSPNTVHIPNRVLLLTLSETWLFLTLHDLSFVSGFCV